MGSLARGGGHTLAPLNPAHVIHVLEGKLLRSIFAGIARVDADLNVVPFAARSWEVLDGGRLYLIHLRPEVCWTDGSQVTAHDYVFAWLRNIHPSVARTYTALLLDEVVGSRLPATADPYPRTRRGTGARRSHARSAPGIAGRLFPLRAGHGDHLSSTRAVVERWGDDWCLPGHIVSNGAFRLTRFHQEHVVLERNELYFGERAGNVAHYEYFGIPDVGERVERFRSGELDLTEAAASPDLAEAAAPPDLAPLLRLVPIHILVCLILIPEPPLDDVRVRRAIALALDRQGLAANERLATGGIVPPGIPGHSPGLALPPRPGDGAPAACRGRLPRRSRPARTEVPGAGCRVAGRGSSSRSERSWAWRSNWR